MRYGKRWNRQGKTITVDPISKRRIPNRGEEEQYLVRNHHEAIISDEIYDKVQEYMRIRSEGRDKANPGRREKFSRQYAFSCMLECGFCGASLTRRAWHSGTNHSKTIWQCVANTKLGKSYCPDSKGVTEDVIEAAFLESYRMLITKNRSVADVFIKNMEKALSSTSVEEKIKDLTRKENSIEAKRKKLLHSYLNDIIAADVYEKSEGEFVAELDEIHRKQASLEEGRAEEQHLRQQIKNSLH